MTAHAESAQPDREERETVDALNAGFYGDIQYPWPPLYFERFASPDLAARLIAQDLGAWNDDVLPPAPAVWVAGCGTNQALSAALRFPDAAVVGSDLSSESLDVCRRNARLLGVTNLELRQETLNDAHYDAEYDYVICTGVIHHTADPEFALGRLARALKPAGVMELMVYNRFHRVLNVAFQEALRLLSGTAGGSDLRLELPVAQEIVKALPPGTAMSRLAESVATSRAAFTDALLQPRETSYTVAMLDGMATRCGLQIVAPCINQFDRASGRFQWDLRFATGEVDRRMTVLSDVQRWHVANLLLAEASPMLWFYLQRADAPHPRRTEREVCGSFLETRFSRLATTREMFWRGNAGDYSRRSTQTFPGPPRGDAGACRLYDELDEDRPLGDTLAKVNGAADFTDLNRLRYRLTTSSFPHLLARRG